MRTLRTGTGWLECTITAVANCHKFVARHYAESVEYQETTDEERNMTPILQS
ncbi:hypothetical protein BN1232_05670 [Mycobacterium lentiflavum]|uniref:Uncharacterized protein n=1 Tax=Mycobacterium lentiflavum TaxID=141349 RepID=A0A0E4H1D5_MYCLN|nr:hypothetical protein BN1232_05670 [Mycobacterium lentiflavum]